MEMTARRSEMVLIFTETYRTRSADRAQLFGATLERR